MTSYVMVDYDKLGQIIKKRGTNWSQCAFACGVHPGTLGNSVKRKSKMRIDQLERIADFLLVQVLDLVSEGTLLPVHEDNKEASEMECMDKKGPVVLQVTDELTVSIPLSEYRQLIEKAVRLDAIADSIRQRVDGDKYSAIDDDIVLMLTGTLNYHKPAEPAKAGDADE